jgi:hypothetical protein
MRTSRLAALMVGLGMLMGAGTQAHAQGAKAPGSGVAVVVNDAKHQVDITVDGKPFTTYLWQTNQRKPVLYPLIAPDGTTVTRGYPFVTVAGERVDHPHHAGLWFNYSNANGFDFWNNSDAIKPVQRSKYGTITQDKIISAKSGKESGELVTESTWIEGDAAAGNTKPILKETARYVFSKMTIGGQAARAIDLVITLTGLEQVVFKDDKDGMLGIRVAHFLESPTEKGGTFMDANGNPTTVAATDTAGATGVYHTSEGKVGDAAWGTRGTWCWLTGSTSDGKAETIAVLDHTGNPGYPTYWHARGYGLFAVNPLGAHSFDAKTPAMNFTIEKGGSAMFKYRVLILSGAVTAEEMNHEATSFDAEYH